MRGHLFKKGKKIEAWFLKLRIDGRQRKIRLGENMTRHEAERAQREKLNEIERNFYRDLKKATFKELAEKWIALLETADKKPRTLDSYRERLRSALFPFFGSMPVLSITPGKIEEFKLACSKRISARTTNYNLLILGMILKKGIHWGYLYQNPCQFVEKLKSRRRQFQALTREQVAELLNAVTGQDRALLTMAVMAGLREGELVAAKWKNLDTQGQDVIYKIRENYSADFGFDTPKTQASLRTIILPDQLVEELRKQRIRQKEHRLQCGGAYQDNDLIFASEIGTPLDPSNLRKMWRHAKARAGLPKEIRFQDLRGTAATLALEAGASVKAVQNLLGHETPNLTLQIYAKITDASRREVADKLGRYLRESQIGK